MSIWHLLDSRNYIKDERIVIERLETCSGCPLLNRKRGQCKVCKCFVKLKAKLGTEDCPRGYWVNLEDYD